MSKVREQLLKKNGIATLMLAKQFLTYSVGDRVPTVTELSKDLKASREKADVFNKTEISKIFERIVTELSMAGKCLYLNNESFET